MKTLNTLKVGDRLAVINTELKDYLNVNTDFTESFLIKKGMMKGLDYDKIDTCVINSKVNGSAKKHLKQQKSIVLYDKGVERIIFNRRQSEAVDVAKVFDISLPYIKEREYIKLIKDSFKDWEFYQQYPVSKGDGGYYYVDLFTPNNGKPIAIEIDEYGHKYNDSEAELGRQNFIQQSLGCAFIRFNPDEDNGVTIGTIINKLRELYNPKKKISTNYELFDEFAIKEFEHDDIIAPMLQSCVVEYINSIKFCLFSAGYNCNIDIKTSLRTKESFIAINEEPIVSIDDIHKVSILKDEDGHPSLDIKVKYNWSGKEYLLKFLLSKHSLNISVINEKYTNVQQKIIDSYLQQIEF